MRLVLALVLWLLSGAPAGAAERGVAGRIYPGGEMPVWTARHGYHHHHAARAVEDALAGPATGLRYGKWRPRWWPGSLRDGHRGIVIRLARQRLYLDAGTRWAAFAVSTGASRPTPMGHFRVVEKIKSPDWSYRGQYVPGGIPGNPLGVCWLGLGMPAWWTGAPIGMHGTNAPWVIGHPASHGCIRLRNEDALALYRWVPVGTPVWIEP